MITKSAAEKALNIMFANTEIEIFDVKVYQNPIMIFCKIRAERTSHKGFMIEVHLNDSDAFFIGANDNKIKVGKFKRISTKSQVQIFERNPKFWEELAKMLIR